MEQRNESIDSLRIIAAGLVVALHAPFPDVLNWFIEPISRGAVPCFFMISGFLSYKADIHENILKIKKQIRNILHILFWMWSAYFLWRSLIEYLGGNSFFKLCIQFIDYEVILRLVVFNKPNAVDYAWYLLALIYLLIIYLVVVKYKKIYCLYFFILPCMIGYFILGKYSMFFFGNELNYYIARNFLFDGFPFFMIGVLFAEKKKWVCIVKNKILIIGAIFSYLLVLIEKSILIKFGYYIETHHYVFTAVFVVFVFAIFLKNPQIKLGKLSFIGKRHSLNIYIIHLYVIDIIEIGLNKYSLVPSIYEYIAPIIVLSISIMLSYVLNFLIRKFKYVNKDLYIRMENRSDR